MKGSTRKRLLSRSLAALCGLCLLLGATVMYAERAAFDSENFANRSVSVLEDDAVQRQIASKVTDAIVQSAPNAIAARPLIEAVVTGIVGAPPIQSALAAGINDVHSTVIEGSSDTVLVTLSDVGAVIRGGLEAAAPNVAGQVPADLDIELLRGDGGGGGVLVDLGQLAERLKILHIVLFVIGTGAGVAAVVTARSRIDGLRRVGRGIAISGAIGIVFWQFGRGLLASGYEGDVADAVRAIYDAFLLDLRTWLLFLTGLGIVVTAGASSSREPVDLRRIGGRAFERLLAVPESEPMRAARAVGLIVAGLIIVTNRDAVLQLAAFGLGALIIYGGAAELMRLAAGAVREDQENVAGEGAPPDDADLGGAALARIAAVGLAVVGAMVLAGFSSDDPEEPPFEITECNGSAILCDRPVDEVVFAGSHNSMSAATNPDWFFAQHGIGISEQLQAGARALLIDPHYGVDTPQGVATDLELDATSGPKIEAGLGPDGVAAAERIRERIGYEGGGDAEVFLCHAFCEVGAIRASDALGELRDFLAANPGEVVILSIEDATTPEDTTAEIIGAGLEPYLFTDPTPGPGESWPTLREMIDSGQRLLVMAEREGGDPVWYRPQFELTKETPYTFKQPEQLEKKASCDPNRGPEDAPFFLMNHWVDTSPAPKPTNARIVNERDFILDRVRRCERIRGMKPSIIAVDFFDVGETVEAVRQLNGLPG